MLNEEPEIVSEKIKEMKDVWNEFSQKSDLGSISFLEKGAEWDENEFHLVGKRFVERMLERFEDFKNKELSDSNILEIGCGVGRFLKPLSSHFKHVVGVDISEEMLKKAKTHLAGLENVTLMVNDGKSLGGINDNSFDYCVSAGVFQHLLHIDIIINYTKEAIRILKPDGVFLFQFIGTHTGKIGKSRIGAKITANDLDEGLKGLSYKICEVSYDSKEPIGNIVIVLKKLAKNEKFVPPDQCFQDFIITDRHWLSGVYDDIRTQTSMHGLLKTKMRKITFKDVDIMGKNDVWTDNREMIERQKQMIANRDSLISKKDIWINNRDKIIEKQKQMIAYGSKMITNMNNDIEKKNEEIRNIYNSRSWRLTKPLRTIFGLFKRLK